MCAVLHIHTYDYIHNWKPLNYIVQFTQGPELHCFAGRKKNHTVRDLFTKAVVR